MLALNAQKNINYTYSIRDELEHVYIMKPLIFALFRFLYKHFFMLFLLAIVIIGWMNRNDNYISAETGTGYFLGILGGSMMVVLMLYPLSKRVKSLTRWIPIRYWFGIHMLLGIFGPLLILFHSNFSLGSTNSTVALVSMLLVAGSGLVGRYIYTHTHHGLFGSHITLKELKAETEDNHVELLKMYSMDEKLNNRLTKMEAKVLKPNTNLITSILHVVSLAFNARRLKTKVIRLLSDSYERDDHDKALLPDSAVVINSVNRYTQALRHTAELRVYERLFSLWHILHLPFFFMMILTAIAHIFAVHLY